MTASSQCLLRNTNTNQKASIALMTSVDSYVIDDTSVTFGNEKVIDERVSCSD